MDGITMFLGLNFHASLNGHATFFRLDSTNPFCDGPLDNELAGKLSAPQKPTGLPVKTFDFSSNKHITQSDDVSTQAVPLNGTTLTLTDPCDIACDYTDIADKQISYLDFGIYSTVDTQSGYDGVVLKVKTAGGSTKMVVGYLVRECIKDSAPGDFLTASLSTSNEYIPGAIPQGMQQTQPLYARDVIGAQQIDILFYTNPDLEVRSSPTGMYCCEDHKISKPAKKKCNGATTENFISMNQENPKNFWVWLALAVIVLLLGYWAWSSNRKK